MEHTSLAKPDHPDGVPEEGCDGRALDNFGESEDYPDGCSSWLREQIEAARYAVRGINNAMMRWNSVAATALDEGRESDAVDTLASLWKRRQLRMNRLRWLRSWLLDSEKEQERGEGRRV